MATQHLNLPPVLSAARIIQPVNKDTALIILQSVLKSGSHKPPNKWMMLVRLLWETLPNQGPFYHVYREWSETGSSRNIRLIVEALLCHYGDFDPLENLSEVSKRLCDVMVLQECLSWCAEKICRENLRPQNPESCPSQKKAAQKDVTNETVLKSGLKKTQRISK
jgi:hypothetical protein